MGKAITKGNKMKVTSVFKGTLPKVVGLAILSIAIETYLIWWAVSQFYNLNWQQAFAIYLGKLLLNPSFSIRKARD